MAAVEQLEDGLGGFELAEGGAGRDLAQRMLAVGKIDDLASSGVPVGAREGLRGPPRPRVDPGDARPEPFHLVHPAQAVEEERLGVDSGRDRERCAIEPAEEKEFTPAGDEQAEEDLHYLDPERAWQVLAGEGAALHQHLADAGGAARSALRLEGSRKLVAVEHAVPRQDLAEALPRAGRDAPRNVAIVEDERALDALAARVEDAGEPALVEEIEEVGRKDVGEVADEDDLAGRKAAHLGNESALPRPHPREKIVEPGHRPSSLSSPSSRAPRRRRPCSVAIPARP